MNYTVTAFYQHLIPEKEVEALIATFGKDDIALVIQYLQSICNYVVWQTVAQSLHKDDLVLFFEKQKQEYENISLMVWLEEKIPDITPILTEVLERVLKSINKEITAEKIV